VSKEKGASVVDDLTDTRSTVSCRRLTEIANEAGTDKGTVHKDGHAYTLVYEPLFEQLRDRPINLLEIGLSIGGPEHGEPASRKVTDAPSVRMWREYFPKARLFGVDISDFKAFETEWFTFHQADCGDEKRLEEVAAQLSKHPGGFDIIVDDGSHASYHQQLTMLKLFALVKPGGLYIIEDLHWQPREYEAKLPEVPRTSRLLEQFIQTGKFAGTGSISTAKWQELAPRIGSTLLFDEDYLYHLRLGHNSRLSQKANHPSYMEMSWPGRLARWKHARHLIEQGTRMAQMLAFGISQMCAGRIKMAIIHKH
jgi:hypothetical protein